MAHFMGTLQGCRGPASRLGSKKSGIHTTARGWDIGARAEAYHSEAHGDVVSVCITGGSNNGSPIIDLGTWKREGDKIVKVS